MGSTTSVTTAARSTTSVATSASPPTPPTAYGFGLGPFGEGAFGGNA